MSWDLFIRFIKGSWWVFAFAAVSFFVVWLIGRGDYPPAPPRDSELIEFDDVTGGVDCYETSPVIDSVKTVGPECPPESEVRAAIEDFMRETDTTVDEIRDSHVWFVDKLINCANCERCVSKAWGCTNGHQVAVLLYSEWVRTLKVELCHVRELSRNGSIDGKHLADCYPPGSV